MPNRGCIVHCLFLHTDVINVLQPGVLNSPKSGFSCSQVALKNLDMVCSWQASNAVVSPLTVLPAIQAEPTPLLPCNQ